MKTIANVCYVAAYASIPVSIFTFMQHSETLGIFLGLWAPTLILTGMFADSADEWPYRAPIAQLDRATDF